MEENKSKSIPKNNQEKIDESELPSWLTQRDSSMGNDYLEDELPPWLTQDEPLQKTISVRVGDKDYQALVKLAKRWRLSPSVAMRRIISEALDPYMIVDEIQAFTQPSLFAKLSDSDKGYMAQMYANRVNEYIGKLRSAEASLKHYLEDIQDKKGRMISIVAAMADLIEESLKKGGDKTKE